MCQALLSLLAGMQQFDRFINFMERQTRLDFRTFVGNNLQRIIMGIIKPAASSDEWAGGCQLPDSVLERAAQMLAAVAGFQEHPAADDVPAFLAGK